MDEKNGGVVVSISLWYHQKNSTKQKKWKSRDFGPKKKKIDDLDIKIKFSGSSDYLKRFKSGQLP